MRVSYVQFIAYLRYISMYKQSMQLNFYYNIRISFYYFIIKIDRINILMRN